MTPITDAFIPTQKDLAEASAYFASLEKPIERRVADRRKAAEQIAARVTISNLLMFVTGMVFALYCLK